MVTVADKIKEWAATRLLSATALTGNTIAYNHVQKALDELVTQDWAQQPAVTNANPKNSEPKGR